MAGEPRESGRGRGHKSTRMREREREEQAGRRAQVRGTTGRGGEKEWVRGLAALSIVLIAFQVMRMLCIHTEAGPLLYSESGASIPEDTADETVKMRREHEEDGH